MCCQSWAVQNPAIRIHCRMEKQSVRGKSIWIHLPIAPSNVCAAIYTTLQSFTINFSIVIDFGGATYTDDRKSTIISTRQYRAPEVMLELTWDKPADIWSAACIIGELYVGDLFFPTVLFFFFCV